MRHGRDVNGTKLHARLHITFTVLIRLCDWRKPISWKRERSKCSSADKLWGNNCNSYWPVLLLTNKCNLPWYDVGAFLFVCLRISSSSFVLNFGAGPGTRDAKVGSLPHGCVHCLGGRPRSIHLHKPLGSHSSATAHGSATHLREATLCLPPPSVENIACIPCMRDISRPLQVQGAMSS